MTFHKKITGAISTFACVGLLATVFATVPVSINLATLEITPTTALAKGGHGRGGHHGNDRGHADDNLFVIDAGIQRAQQNIGAGLKLLHHPAQLLLAPLVHHIHGARIRHGARMSRRCYNHRRHRRHSHSYRSRGHKHHKYYRRHHHSHYIGC